MTREQELEAMAEYEARHGIHRITPEEVTLYTRGEIEIFRKGRARGNKRASRTAKRKETMQ